MTIKVRKTKKLPTEPTSGSLPTKRGGWGGPGPEPGSMPQPKVPYRGTGSAVSAGARARGGSVGGTRKPTPNPKPLPPGVKENYLPNYPYGRPKGKTVTKTAKARKR